MKAAPTILVAEDDSDDKFMLETAIQHSEFTCDSRFVMNGEQLMDYLLRRGDYKTMEISPKPHALVLDLSMPKKDGRLALKEIRESPALKSLPVVILTTSDQPEDMDYCKRLGVSEYFVKPATFQGWLDIVTFLSNLCSPK